MVGLIAGAIKRPADVDGIENGESASQLCAWSRSVKTCCGKVHTTQCDSLNYVSLLSSAIFHCGMMWIQFAQIDMRQ